MSTRLPGIEGDRDRQHLIEENEFGSFFIGMLSTDPTHLEQCLAAKFLQQAWLQ